MGIYGAVFKQPRSWSPSRHYHGRDGHSATRGDFGVLNGQVQGPLMMKFTGFPPFVNYLSWVGENNGVITATRPDGGLWAKRAREDGGDGWLRIGDSTFAMRATEITEPGERLRMMERWASKAGRTLDEPLYEGSEPLCANGRSFSGRHVNLISGHINLQLILLRKSSYENKKSVEGFDSFVKHHVNPSPVCYSCS